MSATSDLQLVVMGVSGCGKSTLAKALSETLSLRLMDGDDLHLPQSIAKMQVGIALEDADRWPWLDRIGQYLAQPLNAESMQHGSVVACSALKLVYRDHIRQQAKNVRFIFLDGDTELIRRRMASRVGHFMQPGLLDSQVRTLERPTAQEHDVLRVNISQPVDELVLAVKEYLHQNQPVGLTSHLQTH